MKRNKVLILLFSVMLLFIINVSEVFATEWINVYNNKNESFKTYDYGNGNYRNEWVWCDRDGDYVAERYCYDDDHRIYFDEVTPDNESVNKDGKWIIDGITQKTYTKGKLEEDEGGIRYRVQYTIYAKDEWLWLDPNEDAKAERYYFDTDGYLVRDRDKVDNYEINSDGAWTIDGNVQEITMGYPSKVSIGMSRITTRYIKFIIFFVIWCFVYFLIM